MDVNVTVSIYPFLSSILWASSIQKTKKICQWLSWMFTGYFLIYWKAGVTHFLGDFSSFWVWNKNIDNNFKFSVNLILFLSLLGPFIFSQLCGQLWWASFPMLSYFFAPPQTLNIFPLPLSLTWEQEYDSLSWFLPSPIWVFWFEPRSLGLMSDKCSRMVLTDPFLDFFFTTSIRIMGYQFFPTSDLII